MGKSSRGAMPTGQRSQSRLGAEGRSALPDSAPGGHGAIASRLVALALVVASVLCLRVLFTNERFRVERLAVSGNQVVTADEIQTAAGVLGSSIFRVQPGRVRAALLARFGGLAEVRVTCRLPNEVRVAVRERPGMLVWESGGRYWWVSADGETLGEAPGPGALMVVHDLSAVALEPTGYIVGPPWALVGALQAQLPNLRECEYSVDYGLVMRVGEGNWPVYLGHSGDVATKVAVAQALVNTLTQQGADVEYIDLRNDARPTFKKRG